MGAHGSKEKLHRSASERFVHTQVIERERFGSFGKRVKGKGIFCNVILVISLFYIMNLNILTTIVFVCVFSLFG